MEFKSLSASSIAVYEGCPERFAAEYCAVDRPQDLSAGFAELGTACHEAMQKFVEALVLVWGNTLSTSPSLALVSGTELPLATLLEFYDTAYWSLFQDRDKYDDGVEMLTRWFNRLDWTDREVLLIEVKETFALPFGNGLTTPVTYIWDRCDKVIVSDDGEVQVIDIEVVDYKTYRMPVQAAELKLKIQPRLYALAAAIRFKDLNPRRIWVTYDLLRHEPVSVSFTREDNLVTWNYLKAVAKRISDDNEPVEKLNPDCRWCIRRSECDSLRIHRDAGGILELAMKDFGVAVDERNAINDQVKALKTLLDDLDKLLLDQMQHDEEIAFATDNTKLTVTVKGQRSIDAERAVAVIGPTLLAHHGKLNMGSVDSLLKGQELSIEQKAALKRLIGKSYGAPSIQTKSTSPHAEDE